MNRNKPIQVLTLTLCLLGRVIPHPWNMTPTITLSLITTQTLGRLASILVTLLGFFIADLVLASLQHHAILGSWSLFTYSGLLFITLLASYWPTQTNQQKIGLLFIASLGFWLWTNLGCWITMPEYSKNLTGLCQCYGAALPFLKNQLLGDGLWYAALSFLLSFTTTNSSIATQQLG